MTVNHAPSTTGYYSDYDSKTSFILAGIQIGIGSVTTLLSIVTLATFGAYGVMAGIVSHLVFGVIMIIAGALGVVAGKQKTTGPIIGFMVLSIIVSIFAIYAFLAYVVIAIGVTALRSDVQYGGVVIAVVYIFVIVYLVESIVSIWSSVICCRVSCCRRTETPEVVNRYQC